MQASLPLRFPALFLRVSRARWLCHRPAVYTRPRGNAVSLRRNEREERPAGARRRCPRRSTIPLILPQQNGGTSAQAIKAAVRRATPCGFAKQTEKGAWNRWESLLSHPIPNPFSTNCRDKGSTQAPAQTQVLWYFLDSRKYRLPYPRYLTHTASISTKPPLGSSATCTQERAG